jgi:hypothetical protein
VNDERASQLPKRERPEQTELEGHDELPVIARMVIEIRSDGSRTIARGAVEDCINDHRVAVDARADSPLELSRALAKMLPGVGQGRAWLVRQRMNKLLSGPLTAGAALFGREQAGADAAGEHAAGDDAKPGTGIRARARALGRRVGVRVERSVRARLTRGE